MPVAVLVRFGGICGGFAVAVLQLDSCCSCCSLGCWTLLLEPLADSPFAVFRVSLGGFWRGASASVHRRVVVTSVAIVIGFTVQTVAQTGDSMVQFWMVVDMHVAVQ